MKKQDQKKAPISLLHEACEALGITQRALAEKIGVSLSTLGNWGYTQEIPLYAKKHLELWLEIQKSARAIFFDSEYIDNQARKLAGRGKKPLIEGKGRYLAQFFNCSALIPTLAENGWLCDKRAKIALKLIKEESLQKEYEQLLDWGIGSYAIEGLSVDEAGRWEVDKCKKELNFSEQILFKELIKQNEGAERGES